MQRNSIARLTTFVVWFLAAGAAVFWALKFSPRVAVPAHANMLRADPASAVVDSTAVAKALGGEAKDAINLGATGALSTGISAINQARFVLFGVVAAEKGQSGGSLALIGMDGKPARPYRVGSALEDGLVLQSVTPRQAVLAKDASRLTLELPVSKTALVGTGSGLSAARAPAVPGLNPPAQISPRAERLESLKSAAQAPASMVPGQNLTAAGQ